MVQCVLWLMRNLLRFYDCVECNAHYATFSGGVGVGVEGLGSVVGAASTIWTDIYMLHPVKAKKIVYLTT